MRTSFNIRLYKGEKTCLSDLTDITLSGITILKKNFKHQKPFVVKGNCEKFGFSVKVKGKLLDNGGSHRHPCISFNRDFIDIEVIDFPRYPAFTQDIAAVKSCLSGWGYTNWLNDGFPIWLNYRKVEITPLL